MLRDLFHFPDNQTVDHSMLQELVPFSDINPSKWKTKDDDMRIILYEIISMDENLLIQSIVSDRWLCLA